MNRRGFLSNLVKGVAAFTILPPATTYDRIWKAIIDPKSIVNPAWETAEYEVHFFISESFNIGPPPRVLDMAIGKAPFRLMEGSEVKRYKINKDKVELITC